MSDRKRNIDPDSELSITKQCELLSVSRSSYYYKPVPENEENLQLMRLIDQEYLSKPYYGSRRMVKFLCRKGFEVNRKRVVRLMDKMGISAIYPKPKREKWEKRYGKFPYLLEGLTFGSCNHVWGTDITYIPVRTGFVYLVAVIDLYSRFVLSWELSNSLDSEFCVQALEQAFDRGIPTIMNSDQGVQFTSNRFIETLLERDVQISMAGKGRCWDNIFVERFWRSLKHEEVYLSCYETADEAYKNIDRYIDLYNRERLHQSLGYKTPEEIYFSAA